MRRTEAKNKENKQKKVKVNNLNSNERVSNKFSKCRQDLIEF